MTNKKTKGYTAVIEARKAAEANQESVREAVRLGLELKRATDRKREESKKHAARNEDADKNMAVVDVIAERLRQVSKEGWSPEHDDEHTDRSLAAAAACYANPFILTLTADGIELVELPCEDRKLEFDLPIGWPKSWHDGWWKPTNRRRNLVKAAALIIAEIARLDRQEPSHD